MRALLAGGQRLLPLASFQLVGDEFLGDVRVGVARPARRRGCASTGRSCLEDGAALAGEVVDEADARRERVPGVEVVLGEVCAATLNGPLVAPSCSCSGSQPL